MSLKIFFRLKVKGLAYISSIILFSILTVSCNKPLKVEEKNNPEFETVLSLFKDEMPDPSRLSQSMKDNISRLNEKCEKDDAYSCLVLADIYSVEHEALHDTEKAVNILLDQCKKNNLNACRNLLKHKALKQDKSRELVTEIYENNISKLKEKCDKDNVESCYKLAEELFYKDINNSFEISKKACEMGSPRACSYLLRGVIFRKFKISQEKFNQYSEINIKNLKNRCDLGEILYCFNLFQDGYFDNDDSDKKINELSTKLKELCLKENTDACYLEGKLKFRSDFPNKDDVNDGLIALNKACDKQNIFACSFLSSIYKEGKKIDKNEDLSFKYLEKECRLGSSYSCSKIAKLYLGDVEHKKNQSKANEFVELAIERGESYDSIANYLYKYNDYSKEKELLLKKGCLLNKNEKACEDLAEFLKSKESNNINNRKQIVSLYEYACSMGKSNSCNILATIYSQGKIVNKNLDKAFEYSKKYCGLEQHLCEREASLYFTTSKSDIREKNDKKALELLAFSCDKYTAANSCNFLAELYEGGIRISKDIDKANRLYSKACNEAKYSDGKACLNLGLNYESGLGVKESILKANEYYRKSCDNKNTIGCVNYAYNLEKGIGFEQNEQNKKTLEKLTRALVKEGKSNLSEYIELLKINKKNTNEKAMHYIKALCDSGVTSKACFSAGLEYHKGESVESDLNKSIEYYKKGCYAYEDFYSGACNNYGALLRINSSSKKDNIVAVEAFKKSCNSKDPVAHSCSNLANAYIGGFGVERNDFKAMKFADKACNLEYGFACGTMAIYNYYGANRIEINYKSAISYGEKGCSLGDGRSCNIIGLAYENGKGIKQDYSKAKDHYGKGCDLGTQTACDNYARVNKIINRIK